MIKRINVKNFSVKELHLLLKHFKLGPRHLKKQLGRKQFDELLRWTPIEEEQKVHIEENRLEKISHFMPILNTILTSVFGAALGFSAMIGFDLSVPTRIAIIGTFALVVSILMGYLSHKMTQQGANQAITDLKISRNQCFLLNTINQKLEKDIEEVINRYNLLFDQLVKPQFSSDKEYLFNTGENVYEEVNTLLELIEERIERTPHVSNYKIYRKHLLKRLKKLKKNLIHSATILSDEKNEKNEHKNVRKNLNFVQILTTIHLSYKPDVKVKRNQDDLMNIAYNLLPALLGTFSSFFVFANGIPDIARKLGANQVALMLSHSHARVFELLMMLLATIYFGICFAYTRKKAQRRKNEIRLCQEKIIEAELRAHDIETKINRLNKIYYQLENILYVLHILNKVKENEEQDVTAESLSM